MNGEVGGVGRDEEEGKERDREGEGEREFHFGFPKILASPLIE